MKKIGIYTVVSPRKKGGVGRILSGLIPALHDLDSINQYHLFVSATQESYLDLNLTKFQLVPCRTSAERSLWNHVYQALFLPLKGLQRNLDALHIPNSLPILFSPYNSIVTINDLAEFAVEDQVYTKFRSQYRKLANYLAAKNATRIITISEFSKKEIIRFLDVKPNKIHVVYPGIDSRFNADQIKPEDRARARKKYNLPEKFFVFIGQIQPRKNLIRVLEAFSQIIKNHPDIHLVLVGKLGWMFEEVFSTLEKKELKDKVHITGYIDDQDIPAVYQSSQGLIFPSLYEGFGFPVLEAMRSQVPVVTSKDSSMSEIADGTALLVNPLDTGEIADAMNQCLSNKAFVDELCRKAALRAEYFSWKKCAEETISVYNHA